MAVPGISDLSVPGMVSIFSKFLIQLIHHFYFVPGVVCRLFLYLHGGGQRCKHHHDQQGLAKVPTFGTGEKSDTKRSKTGKSSSVIYLCLCILARKKTERRAMARWTGGRKVTMKTMFLLLSWTRCDWASGKIMFYFCRQTQRHFYFFPWSPTMRGRVWKLNTKKVKSEK